MFVSQPCLAQQTEDIVLNDPEPNIGRAIDLRSVIEESLRRNPFEQVRNQQAGIIDLEKQNLAESFWMPTVALNLTNNNQRYDRLHTSSSNSPQMGNQTSPNGSVGIEIEDYSLFNWGRDYLAYLNTKTTLNRENQKLNEARRRLKFNSISQYFNLVRVKEILRIKREQLRQASFIHRLAREKLALRKITSQEYYQTRSEFLRSQTEYQQSLFEVSLEEEKIANILGDDFQTSYKPSEELKYVSLNTQMQEALRLALDQSPAFRDAKVDYDNASRSYDKTLKDNLPLPKFTFNLGTYQQNFDNSGSSWTRQTDSNGNRNVEIAASVNMRWTLLGEGGVFNSRDNKQSYLNKRISEIKYFNTKREIEVKVRTIFKTIKFLEQKITIADYQLKNSQSNFDTTLENYRSGRTTYPEIKLSLDNFVNSSINSENVTFEHLLKKLELSDLMGLEDLPGENFEQLAKR